MMQNKILSSLQKTYDECSLICSTATYFEAEGNEVEALRCWHSALSQIHHSSPRHTTRLGPEKDILGNLSCLKNQCIARIELLEGVKHLRQKKLTADKKTKYTNVEGKNVTLINSEQLLDSGSKDKVFDLSETSSKVNQLRISEHESSQSKRSLLSFRNMSESSYFSSKVSSKISFLDNRSSPRSISYLQGATTLLPTEKKPRCLSSDKLRKMKHTLRSGKTHVQKSCPQSRPRDESLLTNKAATLAWNSIGKSMNNLCTVDQAISDLIAPKSRDLDHRVNCSEILQDKAKIQKCTRAGCNSQFPKTHKPSSLRLTLVDFDKTNHISHLNEIPFITERNEKTCINQHESQGIHFSIAPYKESNLSEPKGFCQISTQPKSSGISNTPKHSKIINIIPGASGTETKTTNRNLFNDNSFDRSYSNSECFILESSGNHKDIMNDCSSRRLESQNSFMNNIASNLTQKSRSKIFDQDSEVHEGDTVYDQGINLTVREHENKKISKSDKKDSLKIYSSQSGKSITKNLGGNRGFKKVELEKLPTGVDEEAAKQIFNEIVVKDDPVYWNDIAGLDIAKAALKEAVVYPFLRPDLFMGLREPARGMLLFGPPGTGKTMLARAVATESRSTFFSISASSLISKYLGESEKLVKALFKLAKALAPSIIFVDEIDSLLSSRSGCGEHESTRRVKTEFLIQWGDLQHAAAGRSLDRCRNEEDTSHVLVLAATNMPWAIDEAARRRFVRRQYIPLPEEKTRAVHLRKLLNHHKHELGDDDIQRLVDLTEGYSGSDIAALAKDAAMGPLRSLGESLLFTLTDEIRPISFADFEASLLNIRPSVSIEGLKTFEEWANVFGERGG